MKKKYKPIPALNPHVNCKGHADALLDSPLDTDELRALTIRVLNNYIYDNES